jgi:uncharacterized repeat protein (TIGR01451 family)
MQVNAGAVRIDHPEQDSASRQRRPWEWAWRIAIAYACLLLAAPLAQAAQVQHLNTQTATATGAGASGTPTIASFNIPSGKNRVLFIWPTFERDHCSNADVSGGLCVNNNIVSTGLGDNFPEPRIGTPPATTSTTQLTARVTGPGGTINKQNALVIGGTPSGDTRFIVSSTTPNDPDPINPPNLPSGSAFFSLSSYHIVLFESEINTLLGGAASGTVSISLPDASLPSNAGDDALLIASVFQNVEQTPAGFVRNGTVFGQAVLGVDPVGTYSMTFPQAPTVNYDTGQIPDEADDGKLVMGANGTPAGFATPLGHVALATVSTSNAGGNYDTPNGGVTNEPNGVSGGAYFRNGGGTPGSFFTLTSADTLAPAVYGGTAASFLLESDNADVGDAPISYGNPTHTLSGIRMGAAIDADASLLNNATATGDDANNTDDEDGVTLVPLLPIGQTTVVPVSIQNGSGFLSAWFDWNVDGDFNDAGEQMVTAQAVAVGTVNLSITVPVGAVIGPTFARFRVCTNNAALDNCNTPVGTVQSGEVEDYQFQVGRTLTLRKTTLGGAGGPFGFTLTNTVQTTGSVTTSAANTPTQVDGDTGTAGTQVFTIAAPTTAVTINESSLPAGWSLSGATCVNAASATVGSLSGSTYTITGAEVGASIAFTCTFTNDKLPILRLQKALPNGRFIAADQFTLSIAGTGGPASVTTTGAGNTATGVATLNPGAVGASYTFSEAGASGANLANYATTYACTNALGGGQTPSGTGTTFNVTAAVGDDLTCTFTNTRNAAADLRLSKTNTPGQNGEIDQAADTVVSGTATTYTITVTNLGPDAANGAVVTDPAPTNLSCATATCAAAGGAACPVPTGAALVTALQGAGATVPTLPNGGSVVITLNCTVN